MSRIIPMDNTFCGAKCLNQDCERKVQPIHKQRAENYGRGLSFDDFSANCKEHQPEVAA